jgi:hypothetical protein
VIFTLTTTTPREHGHAFHVNQALVAHDREVVDTMSGYRELVA